MRCLAFVNVHSGGVPADLDAWRAPLGAELARRRIDVEWRTLERDDCTTRLRDEVQSSAAELVLVAGGDGTLSAAAGALCGLERTLLIVPAGTANLLAHELGLPTEPVDALRAALDGERVRIDVAFADDQPFLNSVVFGTFAELAESREALRGASVADAVVSLRDAAVTLAGAGPERFRLETPDTFLRFATNFVVVSNNRYDRTDGLRPGRSRLDAGVLGLYTVESDSAASFVAALARALVQGFESTPSIRANSFISGRLTTPPGLAYTVDGETQHSAGRVDFAVRPRSLPVLAGRPRATGPGA